VVVSQRVKRVFQDFDFTKLITFTTIDFLSQNLFLNSSAQAPLLLSEL
jgi:hypothetical protein